MAKKTSFKVGTKARAARNKMVEGLKGKYGKSGAYAVATTATKRMSPKGKKRMMRHGVVGKKA